MKKSYEKFIVLLLSVTMVFTGSVFAFSAEAAETQSQDETALGAEEIEIPSNANEEQASEELANEEVAVPADEESGETAELLSAGERVDGNITVHYPPSLSEKLDTTATGYYSDDFFNTDNTVYNKQLAKFSLLTSMASYAYPIELNNSKGITRDKNIKELLIDKLKFIDYESFKYDVKLTNTDDTSGYAFAYKELENGERVMAVAVRSSGYGSEWASNLRVSGGGDDHKGFANTASAMYKKVETYAKKNGITKIWITGYSRGAAVANVLGKKVADGNLVGAEDMYCYTFETPTTTKKSVAVQGLYNVINSADVVAQIPFYFWGYKRYGQDKFYVVNKVSLKNYRKGIYPTDKTTKVNLKTLKDKLGTYSIPTQWSNDIALNCISSIFGGNESAFSAKYEDTLQQLGGTFLGGEKNLVPRNADQGAAIVNIMTMIGLHSYMQANGVNSKSVFAQHTPEALLYWMDVISPVDELKYKYITISSGYKKCNIVIKSGKKKVAEIKKGSYSTFVKKYPSYALEVNKDENGNLQILIPNDEKYTFTLTAASAVTVDYKVTSYTGANVSGIADYKSIKLKKKGTITSKGSGYAPKVSKGKIGSKAVYDSTNVAVARVDAEVQGGSNLYGMIETSFVTGIGSYPDKYKVTLTVHNGDSKYYVVDGWYLDGKKISSGSKCTITTDASNPTNLIVKFKEKY